MKNIVFMGTPDFAAHILEHISQNLLDIHARIVGVYCQPDRPAGRGNKLQAPAVKVMAEKLQLPVFQPLNFKNEEDIQILKDLKPDVLVVAAYGLILPKAVLDIPSLGAYNVHASLLPQWRGAAPIHRAIMAGDIQTGITIMKMDIGLDTGDMLIQKAIPIANNENSLSLFDALADLGSKLMVSSLKQIFEMRAAFIPQNHANASYASKILKEEYFIDWNSKSIEIDRKVRALMTARAELRGRNDSLITVQILEGAVVDYSRADAKAGDILLAEKDNLIIATNDTDKAFSVIKIKPQGKNAMAIKDFINGYL